MKATISVAALALAATAGATPAAFAIMPDFTATPYECAAYEAETHSCASISQAVYDTPNHAVATSRIRFAFMPSYTDPNAVPVPFEVTVVGESETTDDVFCSDYAASEFTVTPLDPATPADIVERFTDLFVGTFSAAGVTCAYYTLEDGAWMFHLRDKPNVPPERIWMFDAVEGARLTLRPQPF